jgi:hypothetical protein
MQKCWEEDTKMRPTTSDIVDCLAGPSIGAHPTPLTSDWHDEFTSKFRRSVEIETLLPSVAEIEGMLFGNSKLTLQVH